LKQARQRQDQKSDAETRLFASVEKTACPNNFLPVAIHVKPGEEDEENS
jgi:hypothetical protein